MASACLSILDLSCWFKSPASPSASASPILLSDLVSVLRFPSIDFIRRLLASFKASTFWLAVGPGIWLSTCWGKIYRDGVCCVPIICNRRGMCFSIHLLCVSITKGQGSGH
eukprot:TRINITY_DN14589_c1_g1_i2.p1 TRINITY_DN14589_c1_g1~~TRINITY_DN14589_c1_g1_i2.p1  ORF type:complete len:111 (+),score=8.10 TRINITY_DN14589_c1_g1_i2:215-547(+)